MLYPYLGIDHPYDACTFLDNLQAYNTHVGGYEMLELMRNIQFSGNYYWEGLAIPTRKDIVVPSMKTINGSVVVPTGTYVVGMTHYSSETEGFKFKLYDKGTKASIFYGEYCKETLISGQMDRVSRDVPFGPGLLMSPFIVTSPGLLGWEVVNLSDNDNTIQLMLSCAVPITNRSIGTVVVEKGY